MGSNGGKFHFFTYDAWGHQTDLQRRTILEELTSEAAKIDAKRLRNEVERAAKERVLEKFDDNLDDSFESFNDQLKSTSKIYTSIAEAMNEHKSSNRETVLRIG